MGGGGEGKRERGRGGKKEKKEGEEDKGRESLKCDSSTSTHCRQHCCYPILKVHTYTYTTNYKRVNRSCIYYYVDSTCPQS